MTVLLIGVWALAGAVCRAQQGAASIQSEVERLEGLLQRSRISAVERTRLAGIYFLTSRCPDVAKLLKTASPNPHDGALLCACGAACPGGASGYRLSRFRKLLDSGVAWRDARVQALWKDLRDSPEGQYWALKLLRARRDPSLVPVRAEMEKLLESLDVKRTEGSS